MSSVFSKQNNRMKLKKVFLISIVSVFFILTLLTLAQETKPKLADFKIVVENNLKTKYRTSLEKVCPVDSDSTAERIFKEYGAIFVSNGTMLPGKCIFTGDADLQDYQVRVKNLTTSIGGVQIQLQKPAMEAFLKARREAATKNLQISVRGGSLAAKRSYQDTVRLWNSRFSPALAHWVRGRKITVKEAAAARNSNIREQVEKVLEWEQKGLFFSKDLTKSILFSVAAPGASQHNFMLALDIEQYANKEVRKILAENGWFQTVKSDLPHFTYLGVKESDLPALGLKSEASGAQKFWIPNYSIKSNQKFPTE